MTPRPAALALAAVLLAQVVIGAHYVSRTAILDGDERVYVLWDDAMISMRYARNLAEGHGLVWNPGEEPVQGFTNLGLTLVMAAVHAAGVPRELAALPIQALALLALAGTALLSARMARDLSGNDWAGVGCAIALLACAPHQIYGLQGSDTSFVALLLAAGHAQLIRSWLRDGRWARAAFAPLLAAVVIRPDAALFTGVAAAAIACFPDARGRAAAALPLGALAVVWCALVAFSLASYGDPLPNTYYLKTTGSPRSAMLASGLDQLGFAALGLLPAVGLGAVALLARSDPARAHGRALAPMGLLAGTVASAVAYHVWVGGDWIREYGSRHWVQVVPTALVLGAVGAARIARLAPAGATIIAVLLAAVPGLTASPAKPAREWFQPSTPTLFHLENQMNFLRSRFLERAIRFDARIAVHWAGIGPYFVDRPSLDILGRSDRFIAHGTAQVFVPGHSKWDWDYVLDTQQPDLIDFESRGLREHPSFQRDYLVLRVGPSADLFIRRTAIDKILDDAVQVLPLEAHFGQLPAAGSEPASTRAP